MTTLSPIDLLQTDPLLVSDNNSDLDRFRVHRLWEAGEPAVLLAEAGPRVRGLIATIRRIPQADRFARSGEWLKGHFPLSPTRGAWAWWAWATSGG